MQKLDIIYEDAEIIVLRKEAGVPVQTARTGRQDFVSLLKNYFAAGNADGREPYVGIVHRLDQPVEGVIVFAKNPQAASALSRQIMEKQLEKYYLAVLDGVPDSAWGRLEHFLYQDKRQNCSRVVAAETSGCKSAVLEYQVLDQQKGQSLVKIKLITGRHHQIRVQFSHEGMPLYGDHKYNPAFAGAIAEPASLSSAVRTGNPALCACELSFRHPKTKKRVSYCTKPANPIFGQFDFV